MLSAKRLQFSVISRRMKMIRQNKPHLILSFLERVGVVVRILVCGNDALLTTCYIRIEALYLLWSCDGMLQFGYRR